MEEKNSNQYLNPSRTIDQTQPISNPVNNQRGNFSIILSVLAILILIGGGAYYLGTQKSKEPNVSIYTNPLLANTLISTNPTQVPASLNTQSNKCNHDEEGLTIKPAKQSGWCELSLPLYGYKVTGYAISYPANWSVRLAGAEGMNLIFNEGIKTGKNQELFIQITSTELLLEQADKAIYAFEGSGPDPLVDPKEVVVSKRIENIGDKQILTLLTKYEENLIQRYFLVHNKTDYSSLYMFKASGESQELLEDIKQMISSMNFFK